MKNKKKSGGGKSESLIVQSKVKALIKKGKMKSSSDIVGAVNGLLQWHIQQACERAKANGRKTVRASDF